MVGYGWIYNISAISHTALKPPFLYGLLIEIQQLIVKSHAPTAEQHFQSTLLLQAKLYDRQKDYVLFALCPETPRC